MARILASGVATIDLVQLVDEYPVEDDELRAVNQYLWRGGNATNTLAVLSQLGHHCSWLGTLADDDLASIVRADLDQHDIDVSRCPILVNSTTPTSHITLARSVGSRTIVHYRDLAELSEEDCVKSDLSGFDWLHVEGRNIAVTEIFLQHVRQQYPRFSVSLEIEKPRDGIESLIPFSNDVLFSKHYAGALGYGSAESLLSHYADDQQDRMHVCAWGDEGAWCRTADGELLHSPAIDVKHVLDTRAAGDVFNAAWINARLKGQEPAECLKQACALAGQKCAQAGINNLPT